MINRKKFRKIPLVILSIIVFGMVALKSVAVDFEQAVYPEKMTFNTYSFYFTVTFAVSVLSFLVFDSKFDFWSPFIFCGIFLFAFVSVLLSLNSYDLLKLDYLFAKNVKNHTVNTTAEGAWLTKEIIIKEDTSYVSENYNWEKWYTGNYEVKESRFQHYYYITQKK